MARVRRLVDDSLPLQASTKREYLATGTSLFFGSRVRWGKKKSK